VGHQQCSAELLPCAELCFFEVLSKCRQVTPMKTGLSFPARTMCDKVALVNYQVGLRLIKGKNPLKL